MCLKILYFLLITTTILYQTDSTKIKIRPSASKQIFQVLTCFDKSRIRAAAHRPTAVNVYPFAVLNIF